MEDVINLEIELADKSLYFERRERAFLSDLLGWSILSAFKMKVFVGAENQQDALNLLEELYENGDIDKFIENSIQEVVLKNKTDLKNVDFLNSYIKDPEDDEITIVYDYIGFLGMNVYSVDIEENK